MSLIQYEQSPFTAKRNYLPLFCCCLTIKQWCCLELAYVEIRQLNNDYEGIYDLQLY